MTLGEANKRHVEGSGFRIDDEVGRRWKIRLKDVVIIGYSMKLGGMQRNNNHKNDNGF